MHDPCDDARNYRDDWFERLERSKKSKLGETQSVTLFVKPPTTRLRVAYYRIAY